MRTLLHITDIHFGPNHLLDREDGLAKLVAERSPDYVVVSGDLTRRAKPRQFRAAKLWLDGLAVPVFAVPGNHDVPMYRVWERLLAPFGAWRRHYGSELESTMGDDEIHFVGVNSATNWAIDGGRIGAAKRNRCRAALLAAPADAYRVAVIHHNLIRPAELEGVPRPPSGAREMMAELAEAGADLVLGGHAHQSFHARCRSTSRGRRAPTLLLYAGTAMSSRGRGAERGHNSCHWIAIDGDGAEVEFLWWSAEQGAFVPESRRHFPRWAEEGAS